MSWIHRAVAFFLRGAVHKLLGDQVESLKTEFAARANAHAQVLGERLEDRIDELAKRVLAEVSAKLTEELGPIKGRILAASIEEIVERKLAEKTPNLVGRLTDKFADVISSRRRAEE